MYMTIDIEVPDWANWIAQDYDGEWVFFESKPKQRGDRWFDEGAIYSIRRSVGFGIRPKDWTQELYQIR